MDGGSSDDTMDRLRAWEQSGRLPLRVLAEPGSNISRGRNVAIAAARGPVIASTDAGVRLDSSWLSSLLQPFEMPGEVIPPSVVACGFFVAEPTTVFETAMGATVLPVLTDINPDTFLPSSRSVAFLKTAWEAVGGYPEWLDYCEDLVFDFKLQAKRYEFVFAPTAVAYFRPRGSLFAFFRQYYRYARGDGKAGLWPRRHALRYLTYLGAVPSLLWLSISRSSLWAGLLLAGAAGMLWIPYRRLVPAIQSFSALGRLRATLWVPVIRVTGDIAKMLGYPAGIHWRQRYRSQSPRWRDEP